MYYKFKKTKTEATIKYQVLQIHIFLYIIMHWSIIKFKNLRMEILGPRLAQDHTTAKLV